MKVDLQEVLFKKWQQSSLAHFYILNSPAGTPQAENFIDNWSKSLLIKIISEDLKISKESAKEKLALGMADILIINKEDNNKAYTKDGGEIFELFKFMEYGRLQLSQRFVLVKNPHLISTIFLNKLLKTLEEPQKNTTIFFLHHKQTTFIDTVRSRATILNIPDSRAPKTFKHPEESNLSLWIENYFAEEEIAHPITKKLIKFMRKEGPVTTLIDGLKKDRKAQRVVFDALIALESAREGGYEKKERILQEIQWFQTSETFNNSASERFYGLIHELRL